MSSAHLRSVVKTPSLRWADHIAPADQENWIRTSTIDEETVSLYEQISRGHNPFNIGYWVNGRFDCCSDCLAIHTVARSFTMDYCSVLRFHQREGVKPSYSRTTLTLALGRRSLKWPGFGFFYFFFGLFVNICFCPCCITTKLSHSN